MSDVKFQKHLVKFHTFVSLIQSTFNAQIDLGSDTNIGKHCSRYIRYFTNADLEQQALEFIELLENGCVIKKNIPVLRITDDSWLESEDNTLEYGDRGEFPLHEVYRFITSEDDDELLMAYLLHTTRMMYLAVEWLGEEAECEILSRDKCRGRLMEKLKKMVKGYAKKVGCQPFIEESPKSAPESVGGLGSLLGGVDSENIIEGLMGYIGQATEQMLPALGQMAGGDMDVDKAGAAVKKIMSSEEGKEGIREILNKFKGANSISELGVAMKDLANDENATFNKLLRGELNSDDASKHDRVEDIGGDTGERSGCN